MTHIADNLNVKGTVSVKVYSVTQGTLVHAQEFNNLVTTAGKEFLTRKVVSDPEAVIKIGIGGGDAAADLSDTQLEDTILERDVRFESIENNIASFISTFEEDAPATDTTVREVGLLTDNDLLVCRAVLNTPFTKATTDYLVINWKIQIG